MNFSIPRLSCLHVTYGLPEKPARLRRLYLELEGTVGECNHLDSKRDVRSEVGGLGVELFAKLHHVDSQRTERLAHFGVGLGDPRIELQVYSCLVVSRQSLELTFNLIHIYLTAFPRPTIFVSRSYTLKYLVRKTSPRIHAGP